MGTSQAIQAVHVSHPAPRGRAALRILGALTLLALLALTGCATAPPPTPAIDPAPLIHDELFAPARDVIEPDKVMAISPRMRQFLHDRLPNSTTGPLMLDTRDLRAMLLDALYKRGDLQLEYDAEMTRTAAEAYDAKAGNCLSLAMMTAVFAREMGLPVTFRQIYDEEQWSRVGDLQVVSGHVNIALARRRTDFRVLGEESSLVVDFLPGAQIARQRAMAIDERMIVAMYLNNRAAELMSQAQTDRAYWWARAAWLYDPRLLSALNTLGVIYRRHGETVLAERVFRAVLAREPANVQAMGNLVQALRFQDKLAEAQAYEAQLAALQPFPPFKFFDLGVAAMKTGDYAKARDYFAKEIDRSAYYHEFHFWMALANVGLGKWDIVRDELAKAEEYSVTSRQRQLYSAKLDSLRAKMDRPTVKSR